MQQVHFGHGLGDCVYFAHALPLYVRRGHKLRISCPPDKRLLFEPCGVEITHQRAGAPEVTWDESAALITLTERNYARQNYARCNKAASNFRRPPLPDIGTPEALWEEFCAVRLDLRPFISSADWQAVAHFIESLPRPLVLLHTTGNSFQATKSLPPQLTRDLYCALLDSMPGTLILLDWDERVPKLAHGRVRHLTDDWTRLAVPRLMALLEEADLVIGIDSGPFHAARYTHTPALGIFLQPYHHPARITLPRAQQAAIVPGTMAAWNQQTRIAYNIVQSEDAAGANVTPEFIAQTAGRMLSPPRYLDRTSIGAEVQLQQFVRDWERGQSSALSPYVDRHNSFDRLLRELGQRCARPLIVETGCIRAAEDWRGAGYSTYLLGAWLERHGGALISVDNAAANCALARARTRELTCVEVVCSDSVTYLSRFEGSIDLLLLDSLDCDAPDHATHALQELKAAMHALHERSIVMFDDTVYAAGQFRGKGSQAVPWLLQHGWRIFYSGYQTICVRS